MKIAIIGTVAISILNFRGPLIQKLLLDGHEVFAFAIDFTPDQKKQLTDWGAVPIDYKLSRSGLNPLADLIMMFNLRKQLVSIMPDIVFSYFVKPVIFGTLAARLAKVPKRIAMLEGLGFAFTVQPDGKNFKTMMVQNIQLLLYRVAFPALTRLIFLNHDDRDELLVKHRIKVNNVAVLGGIGLNLTDYYYQKPLSDKIRFLFIGRLLKEKGILDFLAAADIVKIKFPSVEFVVLGSTDTTSPNALAEDKLQDYIKREVIFYPGQVSNVGEWIASSSVFVLPSYREGVPRSTQEAMAIGRPILTTDVPGCRETVIEGVNGFYVPAFDFKTLAEKMIWFIENPDKIESMGLASRKIAEKKFDENKVNQRMVEILGV